MARPVGHPRNPRRRRSPSNAADLRPPLGQRPFPDRVAALSAPARQMHQVILQAFLEHGSAPRIADLRPLARGAGLPIERLLTELVVHDVIQRTVDGNIGVAYPFAATPTVHQVQLEGGLAVFAMCVIDALGLPFMAGRSATILTEDPVDTTPISISIGCGRSGKPALSQVRWDPETAVVVVNRPSQGPAIQAECSCPYLNAFASSETAQVWRAAHPDLDVLVLTQPQATREARKIFGTIYHASVLSSAGRTAKVAPGPPRHDPRRYEE